MYFGLVMSVMSKMRRPRSRSWLTVSCTPCPPQSSRPEKPSPETKSRFLQSDVSVYKNLLFVSGEGFSGRLDCGGQGVQDTVSHDRLRGLRIFDITRSEELA